MLKVFKLLIALLAIVLLVIVTGGITDLIIVETTQAEKEACVSKVIKSGKPRTVFDDYIPSDENGVKLPIPRRAPGIYLSTSDHTLMCHITDDGSSPSLSPDGDHIAFSGLFDGTYETDTLSYFPRPTDIFVTDLDGSNGHRITSLSNEFRSGDFYYEPVWSPDGKHIAFVEQQEYTDNETINLVNVDGSVVHCLCVSGLRAVHPKWTNDGKQIIFLALYYEKPYSMWFIVNADGTDPHPYTGILTF